MNPWISASRRVAPLKTATEMDDTIRVLDLKPSRLYTIHTMICVTHARKNTSLKTPARLNRLPWFPSTLVIMIPAASAVYCANRNINTSDMR